MLAGMEKLSARGVQQMINLPAFGVSWLLIPDINLWAASVQAAVTAIRTAGATSQIILLPGNDYTSAESFVSGGSAAALCAVTNLDGSKSNLVFDVHKYLDSDGSGTNADCVSNQIDTSFSPLATYLRANNRQALLSETGGGSSNSDCLTAVCQALSFLDANSDVYLGYIGWAAGSFATNYVLSMTPFGSAATGWSDQELVSQCFAIGATGSNSTTTASVSTAAATPATTTSATFSTATTTLEGTVTQATTASVSSTTDAIPVSSASSTSSVSTTTFPYSFPAAAPTYTDSPVSTNSASSVSTTTFPYTYTAAAPTYTDSPVSTTCTCSLTPTYVSNNLSTLSTSTTYAYTYPPAPNSYTDAPLSSTSTSTTVSTSTSTTFGYNFSAAPTTISTPTSASASGAASSAPPSTTEMYSFAPAPTVETTPVITAPPSGFTTVVRPSTTEEAGSSETGGAGDGDTCYS
ncbi:hypothetical protein MMC17_000996 [Xylographa soralifera]|nr:hypothetical protein [Xylographa soralifera]